MFFFPNFVDIRCFIIPIWSKERLPLTYLKHPHNSHRSNSPDSRLLCLCDELFDVIFSHVDDIVDAGCLCLADGRLLSIGFLWIGKLQKLKFVPWVGESVICLGQHTRDDDYPPNLQELVNYKLMQSKTRNLTDNQPQPPDMCKFVHMVRHDFADGGLGCIHPLVYSYVHRQLSQRDKHALAMLIEPEYRSPHPWMLCNLTKREYVHVNVLATLNGVDATMLYDNGTMLFDASMLHANDGFYNAVTLGQALLSRICWSSVDDTSMPGTLSAYYEPRPTEEYHRKMAKFYRGSWAGDRFEVTTTDRLRGSQWKDVGKEVGDLLSTIGDARYRGSSWREDAYSPDLLDHFKTVQSQRDPS